MRGKAKASSRGAGEPSVVTGHAHPDGHRQVAELQRARMLTAMLQEVSERGAAKVNVGHVVARSGVSRRTFYEIFDDREDCFLAAFDEALQHAAAVVVPAYGTGGAWLARVRASVTALLGFLDRDRAAARLLVVESLAAGPEALRRRQEVISRLVAVVDRGRSDAKAKLDPPALTAEAIVGGLLSVLHGRLATSHERETRTKDGRLDTVESSLLELAGPLMGMIVLPYLGPVAARKEIERPAPVQTGSEPVLRSDPLQELPMRFTYRTMRVLVSVAENPGSSNRTIGQGAGIADQGQASKLLARLHKLDLIENRGGDPARGEPNAWILTNTGQQVHDSIAGLGD
ncbi:MAG: TetR/AcrR family transcriptional regulator [Solirubrobacteraceae bacterium]